MNVVRGALALAVGVTLFSCRGQVPLGGQQGSGGEGVGAACIPSQELSTTFLGFDAHDVTLDPDNVACGGGGVCLVNHYQGRVTCPYGQNTSAISAYNSSPGTNEPCKGTAPSDANSACCAPGSEKPVIASQDVGSATPTQSFVLPSCSDRLSAKTVTCSCRCANAAGKTDDGAEYCSCPGGFACTQLVPELTLGDPLAGAYCIANGTAWNPITSCTGSQGCDPLQPDCPQPVAGTNTPSSAGAERTYFVTATQWGSRVCVPFLVATGASGMTNCIVLASPGAGQSCSDTAGLSVADPAVVASAQQALKLTIPEGLCEVSQLAAPCDTATQPGWCYLTGANATICDPAVTFSTGVPAGSFAIVGCY